MVPFGSSLDITSILLINNKFLDWNFRSFTITCDQTNYCKTSEQKTKQTSLVLFPPIPISPISMASYPIRVDVAELTRALDEFDNLLPVAHSVQAEDLTSVTLWLRQTREKLTRMANRISPAVIRNSGLQPRLSQTMASIEETLLELENQVPEEELMDDLPKTKYTLVTPWTPLSTPYQRSGPLREQQRKVLTAKMANFRRLGEHLVAILEPYFQEIDAFLAMDDGAIDQMVADQTQRPIDLETLRERINYAWNNIQYGLSKFGIIASDLRLFVQQNGTDALQQVGHLETARQLLVTHRTYENRAAELLVPFMFKSNHLKSLVGQWHLTFVATWFLKGTAQDQQIIADFNGRRANLMAAINQIGPLVSLVNLADTWRTRNLDALFREAPQTRPGERPQLIEQMMAAAQVKDSPPYAELMRQVQELKAMFLDRIPGFVLVRCGIRDAANQLHRSGLELVNTAITICDDLGKWLATNLPVYNAHWQRYWQDNPQGGGRKPGQY